MSLHAAMATLSAGLLLVLAPNLVRADDKALPHQQVVNAIQTAVAAHPGRIKEVETDRKDNRPVVEVKIVGNDGQEREIHVDAEKNAIIR